MHDGLVTSGPRVPRTAALLVAGLALGVLHLAAMPHLTKALLFAVFLPGLLYEAAYHLELHELRASAWTIGLLAVPGVVLAIGLTAALLIGGATMLHLPVTWRAALLFGAVIAATDPVAVTALFRELGTPRQLHVLVESESLLNDGTSIVFLTLLLSYLAGEAPTASSLTVSFLRITTGGAAIGAAIGWGIAHLRRRVDHAGLEVTLGIIVAYGSFLVAEQAHCSGVIATVAAGVASVWVARRHPMGVATQAAVTRFWEWFAFALTSAVFLLLGAEISAGTIAGAWPVLALGAIAALAARATVVALTAIAVSRSAERHPPSWSVVLTWGGLRGALSLVLALSLPIGDPSRPLVVGLTASAVTLSLLVQGTTMRPLLHRLGMAATRVRE